MQSEWANVAHGHPLRGELHFNELRLQGFPLECYNLNPMVRNLTLMEMSSWRLKTCKFPEISSTHESLETQHVQLLCDVL